MGRFGLQLDVGGRVEGDQLLGDRSVQRGSQRGADALTRGRSDDAAEGIHLGDGGLQYLAAGAVGATLPGSLGEVLNRPATGGIPLGDVDVGLGEGLEHLRQAADAKTVQADVPDPRFAGAAVLGLRSAFDEVVESSAKEFEGGLAAGPGGGVVGSMGHVAGDVEGGAKPCRRTRASRTTLPP
ncbi:hypothetical protein ACH4TE_32585 [Streptomyces sioyaensis]|uniref:hypothetical protein n=1 Tax=Streptomyces sioyaensis TaxID=67364 RepID=UPI003790E52C